MYCQGLTGTLWSTKIFTVQKSTVWDVVPFDLSTNIQTDELKKEGIMRCDDDHDQGIKAAVFSGSAAPHRRRRRDHSSAGKLWLSSLCSLHIFSPSSCGVTTTALFTPGLSVNCLFSFKAKSSPPPPPRCWLWVYLFVPWWLWLQLRVSISVRPRLCSF